MDHPDVVNLEKRLNKVWDYRDNEKLREELKNELDVDEQIPPQFFYCRECKKDYFPQRIVKVEAQDWNTHGTFRFWRSKHCGRWNVRLITQKVKDKFWLKSPSVLLDRKRNALDLLQPGETGFNMLYGSK